MKYREIEKANPLDDADVVGVIGSMIKQRKDSAAQFAKGTGRSWPPTRTRRSPFSKATCRAS